MVCRLPLVARVTEGGNSNTTPRRLLCISDSPTVLLMRAESSSTRSTQKPRFLWDYDLNEAQVRAILAQETLSPLKRWLIERILSECRFDEVCNYLDLNTIRQSFTQLRLPPEVRARWEYALRRWTT